MSMNAIIRYQDIFVRGWNPCSCYHLGMCNSGNITIISQVPQLTAILDNVGCTSASTSWMSLGTDLHSRCSRANLIHPRRVIEAAVATLLRKVWSEQFARVISRSSRGATRPPSRCRRANVTMKSCSRLTRGARKTSRIEFQLV
ncbi:hypothetical protein C8Q72DRAFT_578513 [Fomitopsis betulina]|nr:hypothetical protein C8Q72DRAFT_578513 [Fomitopsis betulina]